MAPLGDAFKLLCGSGVFLALLPLNTLRPVLNLVDFNLSLVKVAKKKVLKDLFDHILFLSFPDKQYLQVTVYLTAVGPMSQGIIAC